MKILIGFLYFRALAHLAGRDFKRYFASAIEAVNRIDVDAMSERQLDGKKQTA